MKKRIRILIVEDAEDDALLMVMALRRAGYELEFERVETEAAMQAALRSGPWDAVISDYSLPQFNAPQALQLLRNSGLDLPFIIVTGTAGETAAVEAMRAGAHDYLTKEHLARLAPALERELQDAATRQERRLAQELLDRSEESFRQIFEEAPVGMILLDVDGRLLRANESFCVMLERTEADLIGVHFADFTHPDDLVLERDLANRLLAAEIPFYEVEKRYLTASGEFVWGRLTAKVLRNFQGRPLVGLGLTENISEKKRAQAALRESEKRYRSLIDSMMEGVLLVAAGGQILTANKSAERILGIPLDQLQGRTPETLFAKMVNEDGAPLASENRPIATALRTGKGTTNTVIGLYHPDGKLSWVSVNTQPQFQPDNTRLHAVVVSLHDVTEQILAEDSLRESEERFRTTFAHAPMGMAIVQTDGRLLRFNRAWEQILGYTETDLRGRNFQSLTHPDDIDQSIEYLEKLNRAELDSFSLEKRYLNKQGQIVWVLLNVSAVRDRNQKVLYFISLIQDITKRKQAEENLSLFRQLIDQSNDAIYVIDPVTGLHVDANESACANLGYTREELSRLRVVDLDVALPPTFSWEPEVAGLKARGSVLIKGRHRRKDGTTFPVEVNVKYIPIEPGYIVAVVRDITEREQTEQKLREQAHLLDQTLDAIVVRDLENRIQFWSQGAENLYGYSREEALNRKITELIYRDTTAFEKAFELVKSSGAWNGELHQVTRAGKNVIVNSRWTLVHDEQNQPQSILVINTDITEKKLLENQMLRSQRLEGIGHLAGGIAHDLNNILAPILMSVEVLRMNPSEEEAAQILTAIEGCTRRGADVVKQLLTFARGADGEQAPLKISQLIREMAQIVRETFPRNIFIETQIADGIWPVIGNVTQLHQVLLNLCLNARDAMLEGGTITITAKNLMVDDHYAAMTPGVKTGAHILLTVQDTGSGIPASIIDKIFDPFFTTKAPGHGTGLGLSTVIGIIRSHHGAINLQSDPGRGTTFKILLPAAPNETADTVSTTASKPPRGNGETILVVDDEPGIRKISRSILERSGYQVVLASDGAEAMAMFVQNVQTIKLVLTDVMMPYMDGIALVRALKRTRADIRIIVSSGHSMNDLENMKTGELRAMGIHHFLAKPYNADALLRLVHSTLQEN